MITGSRPIDDLAERFLCGPKLADAPYPGQMEPNLVIEFYSC
jgi:hypothetical protein